jgi:hypothetical protein
VYGPSELKEQFKDENDGIFYAIAKYGYIPYGKKLLGRVYISDPIKACHTLNTSHIHFEGNENDPRNSPILLVERGYCSFVTKTRHAQLIGAKMVIVIDNDNENTDKIILADDGKGSDVTIPTIMVSKEDGEKFKTYLQANPEKHVQVSVYFPMNITQDIIKVDLWYTAADKTVYEFVSNISNYLWAFGQQIKFTPHFVTWYSASAKSTNWTGPNPSDCLSAGRYCAPDPDNDGPLNGGWVIREDLSQICIYRTWDVDGYFHYMLRVHAQCMQNPEANLQTCPNETLYSHFQPYGDMVKYEACLTEGVKHRDIETTDNWMLEREREAFTNADISFWPSLIIDQTLYQGHLFPIENIVDVICKKFPSTKKPDMCTDVEARLRGIEEEEESDFNIGMIFVFCLIFIVVFVVFLYWYRRVLRKDLSRDMSMQLQHMISDYAAFKDSNKLIKDSSNL